MPDYETEKIRCRDVRVGDMISFANNRTCDHLVREIEEDVKIAGLLSARRLHPGNAEQTLFIRNFAPGKPMRRRVV